MLKHIGDPRNEGGKGCSSFLICEVIWNWEPILRSRERGLQFYLFLQRNSVAIPNCGVALSSRSLYGYTACALPYNLISCGSTAVTQRPFSNSYRQVCVRQETAQAQKKKNLVHGRGR